MGGGGGGGEGGGGGGGGGEKKTESKTVAVQTDFPAQLLESYVVKHKARYQTLGNLQEFTWCGLSEHIQKLTENANAKYSGPCPCCLYPLRKYKNI